MEMPVPSRKTVGYGFPRKIAKRVWQGWLKKISTAPALIPFTQKRAHLSDIPGGQNALGKAPSKRCARFDHFRPD